MISRMTADNHNHNQGHRVDIIDIPSPRTSSNEDAAERESTELSSGWDNATDVLLTTWREEAKKFVHIQTTSYFFYRRLNNWITYPSILLSAFASIGTFATVHESSPFKFALAAAAFASGTLVAVNKHLRAAEKSQAYLLKVREFENLVRDIDFIQSQQRTDALIQLKADFERITATSDAF
jgi:hypothetical protein